MLFKRMRGRVLTTCVAARMDLITARCALGLIVSLLIRIAVVFSAALPVSASAEVLIELSEQEQAWLEQTPTITIGFDEHFPPYSFINDDGELEGFAVDVVDLLSQYSGVEFSERVHHTWETLYEQANTRDIDVVATMVDLENRRQQFFFSRPYIEKALVIIGRGDDDRLQIRDDLAGKTVAMVRSYQYVERILQEYPSVTPYYVDTILDALTAVSTGDADAAITFLGAGHFYRNKYILANLRYVALYDNEQSPESIAVRRDWPELASILEKALAKIPEYRLHKLRGKWLPRDYDELLVDISLTEDELRWIQDNPVIRLGVDPEFAPFEFIESGAYAGMASDYIDILNQRLNINMQVEPNLSWDEVIDAAKRKEIDVLPAVGKTKERKKYLKYSEGYLSFYRVIVTRDDAPFVMGLTDLDNLRVGVQAQSSHHGFLLENSDITPYTYPTLKKALFALSSGEVDAFVGNVASTTYWVRALSLNNLKVAAPVSTDVESLYFAVRKDWPEFVSILNKGLSSITPRQHKEIAERWLSFDVEPPINYRALVMVVIFSLAALFFIVVWNLVLARKVRQRTQEVLKNAHYDQLTALPNRFLIQDRFQQMVSDAERGEGRAAVMTFDLDNFKKVNANINYQAGDRLLNMIASKLLSTLKDKADLGRLGGDQYLAIVDRYEDVDDLARIAEHVIECVQQKWVIDDHALVVTAGLGIAVYPEDGTRVDQLLKHADLAMRDAKRKGPGSYAFYAPEQFERARRGIVLEEAMREGINSGEFSVHFQPKLSVATKTIVGVEALLRWTSKTLGPVSPAEFIPVAEKSGLIMALGDFVLEYSLASLAEWRKEKNASLTMAVNLSPMQFRNTMLCEKIERLMKAQKLDFSALELEITEGMLMDDYEHVSASLNKLEKLGVRLAMDDFGTGYSSMSNLRKYAFDTLKVDREFISELEENESDRNLVAATISMAHGLGMTVVAEGVETAAQLSFLEKQRCDLVQGWYFSRAVPIDKLEKLFDEGLSY